MAAALLGDDAQGTIEQVTTDRLVGAVVWIHHVFQLPTAGAPGDLGVADRMVMTRLPRHQAGESLPATLDDVEPLVVAPGTVTVGGGRHIEQYRHGGDVARGHLALALKAAHRAPIYCP